MVPTIYAYKEEVKQYIGRKNIILIEDGVLFYITKAIKALYNCNDV